MEEIYKGSKFKLNIHIEPMGTLSMDDYDYTIEVSTARKSVKYTKAQTKRVDEHNCLVMVDSNNLELGQVEVLFTAHVPDADFEDSVRTEIMSMTTDVVIVRV